MSFSFSQGQQLTIDGCRHIVGLVNEKQQCQLTSDDGELLVKTIPELVRLYSEGRLRGLRPTQALALTTHEIVDLANIPDVEGLKKEAVKEAVLKHMCIKHLLEAGLWTCAPEKITPLLADYFLLHGEGKSYKRTVMYQAYRRYIDSGGDWRAQLPRYFHQGNRTRRYTKEIYELAREALESVYLTSQQRSVAAAYRHLQLRIYELNKSRSDSQKLAMPGPLILYRMIKRYPKYDVFIRRRGHMEARKEFPRGIPVPRPSRPLDAVEIDHTPADVVLIDSVTGEPLGRPTITLAVDGYSGCIVGLYVSFAPPNLEAVLSCLRHVCLPKDASEPSMAGLDWPCYGVPRTLVCDNGAEFHAKGLTHIALDLGVEIPYCGAGQANQKASVERTIGALNAGLLHQLPGTTRSNYEELGAYKAEKEAVLTFERFMRILNQWICNDYHMTPRRLDGKTPLEVWKGSMRAVDIRLARDPVLLDRLLGHTKSYKLGKGPLIIDNIPYTNAELGEFRRAIGVGKMVQVRFFDSDLSFVEVINPLTHQPLRVPAEDQAYTRNLTRQLHRMTQAKIRKDYKKKSTGPDLLEARLQSEAEIEEGRKEGKKIRRKVQLAKGISSRSPSGTHAKPVITPEESIGGFRWSPTTDDRGIEAGFETE